MTKLSLSISTPSSAPVQDTQPSRISISQKLDDQNGAVSAASSVNIGSVLAADGNITPDPSSQVAQQRQVSEADIEAIVNERIAQRVEKYNAKFQEMRQQMENLELERDTVARKLNSAIQLKILIDEVFGVKDGASPHQRDIIDTLREAADNGDDRNLPVFVIRFAKGWVVLQRALAQKDTLEKGMPQLNLVYDALTYMMTCISGCFASERRTLLELVAGHCCDYFQEFVFISPEHTVNFDPEIHSVSKPANGSSTIREGLSFTVIRSDTKKTVKYADVVLA